MPTVLTVSTNGTIEHRLKSLKRIKRTFPQAGREGIRKWGGKLARDTKNAAMNAPNSRGQKITPFTGTLFSSGIRWDQGKRSDTGGLFIRQYGIYLDSMRPKRIAIKRSRGRLLAWSRRAISNTIRKKARRIDAGISRSEGLSVRPHPFIRRGFNTARPKLPVILKQELSKQRMASAR